jgi:hypothetical protein
MFLRWAGYKRASDFLILAEVGRQQPRLPPLAAASAPPPRLRLQRLAQRLCVWSRSAARPMQAVDVKSLPREALSVGEAQDRDRQGDVGLDQQVPVKSLLGYMFPRTWSARMKEGTSSREYGERGERGQSADAASSSLDIADPFSWSSGFINAPVIRPIIVQTANSSIDATAIK